VGGAGGGVDADGSNAGAAATVDVGGVAALGGPGIIIPCGGAPPLGEYMPAGGVAAAYADCAGDAAYELYDDCAGARGNEGAPP
jgi:hypothetical protein